MTKPRSGGFENSSRCGVDLVFCGFDFVPFAIGPVYRGYARSQSQNRGRAQVCTPRWSGGCSAILESVKPPQPLHRTKTKKAEAEQAEGGWFGNRGLLQGHRDVIEAKTLKPFQSKPGTRPSARR